MAMTKLYIICGNCGCSSMWVWRHYEEENQYGEKVQDEDVRLTCNNCGTMHSINEYAIKGKTK